MKEQAFPLDYLPNGQIMKRGFSLRILILNKCKIELDEWNPSLRNKERAASFLLQLEEVKGKAIETSFSPSEA